MERRNNKREKIRGAIMMESLIVYPVTIFLLFFILAVFSVLFQRWNIQTIANESAMRMAQTYRFAEAEDDSGYVTQEQLVGVGPYRYVNNVFSGKMESSVSERISRYAKNRLSKTTYTKNVTEPKCDVEVIGDTIGRRHVEVTLTGAYAVPFGQMLSYFGFGGTTTYEVTARAECVDIIDYVNLVDFVEAQASLSKFSSSTIGLIDSVLSLFHNIFN